MCKYLGRYKDIDLYVCEQGGIRPTWIARYSSEAPDYQSCPITSLMCKDIDQILENMPDEIVEAYKRHPIPC
jgi:hypothetical protein